jgi:hypothetical protein
MERPLIIVGRRRSAQPDGWGTPMPLLHDSIAKSKEAEFRSDDVRSRRRLCRPAPSELDCGWPRLNCHEAGRKPSFAEGTQSSSNEVMVNLSCSNWLKMSTCVGFVLCGPWRS